MIAGVLIAAPLLGGAAVPSGVQDFEFVSFSADYYLSRDAQEQATLRTVETFVAQFPDFDQNRGIIRAIPNDYDGVPLETAVQSVVDERGNSVPFESTVSGGFTELALGTDDYVHGRTTYVISYTQRNVVRAFTDTGDDEFYWDTNGTGFNQPFGTVSARVHVDPSIAQYLTGNNACYFGAEGSTTVCSITASSATQASPWPSPSAEPGAGTDALTEQVFTATATQLGPGENLTVVVGFQLGTFVQVPPESTSGPDYGPDYGGIGSQSGDAPWWTTAGSIGIALLAVLGASITIVRRVTGPRNAKGRGIIIPQYTVPKGINLMQAGELIKRTGSGIPAQLVSLAVRGKLRILDYPVTAGGAQFTLQLTSADGVDEQERTLLQAMFGKDLDPGAVQEVGVANTAIASAMSKVRSAVAESVLVSGLKAKRSSLGGCLTAVAIFMLGFVGVAFFVVSAFFGAPDVWGFAAIVIVMFAFVVTLGFAIRGSIVTEAGADMRDYLEGMRVYLTLAEADRFRMLQSPEGAQRVKAEGFDVNDRAQVVKLYEKLLPFAVLWGVEREWAKELVVFYEAESVTPDWFVSSNTFNAALFAQSLGAFSTSVTASSTAPVSTSSWSGSGGGSFSGGSFGGGFSGGGGGGGGGGGR